MEGKRISIPWTTVALALMIALVVPWAVWADVTVPDGDGTIPVGPEANPLQLGVVCTGSTTLDTVLVAIKRNGTYGSTNVFKKGSTVTITVLSVSGTGLSASVVAPGTISIPSNWDTVPNNTMSPDVTSNVTFVAGSTPGAFSGSITYRATGIRADDTTLTRDGAVSVNATIQSCAPPDTTPPTASPTQSPTANSWGWNNTNVTVTWNWADNVGGSGIDPANCTMESVASAEGEYNVTATCKDVAGNTGTASYGVKIDKTAPSISAEVTPAAAATGWWNGTTGAPTVKFTCNDGLSGLAGPCPADYTFGEGENQSHSQTIYDKAGNSASAGVSDIDVDLTQPTVSWSNGPADGGSYYFGFVPAAPICTAADALSGPNGCTVTGYGTTVGSHTLTATAYDLAGNSKVETRSYTVLAWTLYGFYRPVDPDPTVWNTVKGGSTVPLKFEIFAGPTELTLTSYVKGFAAKAVPCPTNSYTAEEVEFTTTGGTALRYDLTDGQFIQNWQTPKRAGSCYEVTMTTLDGSSLSAKFMLK